MTQMGKKMCLAVMAVGMLGLVFMPQAAEARKKSKEKTHMMQGEASWYGENFHGKITASGPVYDMHQSTAAHRTLPFGTVLEVKDVSTGKKTVVCITDRGPVSRKRCIDLSRSAAMELDLGVRGVTDVTMRLVGDTSGQVLDSSEAFYVQVQKNAQNDVESIGPFSNFADAAAIQDVLQQSHEKAIIVVADAS